MGAATDDLSGQAWTLPHAGKMLWMLSHSPAKGRQGRSRDWGYPCFGKGNGHLSERTMLLAQHHPLLLQKLLQIS